MKKTYLQSLMVILFILTVSMPVQAGMTGNDLLRRCQGQSENAAIKIMNDTFCLGVIAGYTDALRVTPSLKALCIPQNAEWEQRRKVVVKYMNEYPEKLHQYYGILILDAVAEAFPCDETSPGS